MVGPVFHQEMLTGARRSRLHVFRWIYAGWLVVTALFLFFAFLAQEQERAYNATVWTPGSAPQVVGQWFVDSFLWQQMILLLLATPALVAGAITDEKRRGTLQHLLTTDLDTRHIILGKLFARVAQVALLAVAGLPLFLLFAGFAGIEPRVMLLFAVVLVMPLFGLGAATLLASVLCRQTRDAVLALYLIGIVAGILVRFVGGPLRVFDPLWVLEPVYGPASDMNWTEALYRLVLSGLAWATLAGVCLGVAIWRLRPTYIREMESPVLRNRRWYSGEREKISDQPVRWRETHVEGLSPVQSFRNVPQWLVVGAIALATTCSSLAILAASMPAGKTYKDVWQAAVKFDLVKLSSLLPEAEVGFNVQSLLVLLLASLIVGIRCSGSVTGEREKNTWEALLLTPISAKQMIHGKLWGIMGASYWYVLAYAAPAVALSVFGGVMSLWWTSVWLAVTFLAMYFVGAAGMYSSVKSKNSWRSLLATVGWGYLGGIAIFLIASPATLIAALILFLIFMIIDRILQTSIAYTAAQSWDLFFRAFQVSTSLTLALVFFLVARLFLSWAQRWVADRERTRHWHEEPIYRRPRRRVPETRPVR